MLNLLLFVFNMKVRSFFVNRCVNLPDSFDNGSDALRAIDHMEVDMYILNIRRPIQLCFQI